MPDRGDFSPAHRSRIRIGFGPEPQQAGDGPSGETPGGQPADCNFTMRGAKSLAYDLVVRRGRVNSRVALLLRAIERNPLTSRFFLRECPHRTSRPPSARRLLRGWRKGGGRLAPPHGEGRGGRLSRQMGEVKPGVAGFLPGGEGRRLGCCAREDHKWHPGSEEPWGQY